MLLPRRRRWIPNYAAYAALRGRVSRHRERIRTKPALNVVYRVVVGMVGAVILALGLLMVPYPGPGWLVVFLGLAVLASEFRWARRINAFARHRYQRWMRWLGRQHPVVKAAVSGMVCAAVVLVLWVADVFGLINNWLSPRWSWLDSPLGRR